MIEATCKIIRKISISAEIPIKIIEIGEAGDVEIVDQDDNVIETVAAPGTYHVTVLTTIRDTIDSNESEVIIDPIS